MDFFEIPSDVYSEIFRLDGDVTVKTSLQTLILCSMASRGLEAIIRTSHPFIIVCSIRFSASRSNISRWVQNRIFTE
jgi:hypothetical protein